MASRSEIGLVVSKLGNTVPILLGGIFVFSSFTHLQNPFLFLESFLAYKVVGGWPALFIASILPFIELAIAVLFFAGGSFRYQAAAASVVLFGCFLLAQISVLFRGIVIDCGCFGGVVKHEVGWTSVLLLVFLSAAACFSLLFSRMESVNESVAV